MIRPMIMEDLASVLEIYNDAILNTTSFIRTEPETLEEKKKWFLENEKENNPMFVYEEDGEVVGFATYNNFVPMKGINIRWSIPFMYHLNTKEKESERSFCKH